MSWLLDTNVISELVRARPDPRVLAFIHEADEDRLYLSAITWAEIRRGIALLPVGRKRQLLEDWLAQDLRARFQSRILPIDAEIAEHWGSLMAAAKANGQQVSTIDGLIAASAVVHDLQLVTRNTKDFAKLGVRLFNPWTSANPDDVTA
jgi:hypothetical protein